MNPYVVLFSGTKVAPEYGAPTVVDMAQSLCRIPRFAGNGLEWFPVALHSFIVADLLPLPLKIYGLLHDGPECVGSDVPRPVKTQQTSDMEDAIFHRILMGLGLPDLSEENHRIMKLADNQAMVGEVHTLGPIKLRADYPNRNLVAEKMVLAYAKEFPVQDCTGRGSRACHEFVRRFEIYYTARQQWELRAIAKHFQGQGKPNPLKIIG